LAATGIRIGELMKRSGVTRATVHHYVREGLLPEPVKTSRNMALYAPDCVDRVLLIKSLQNNYRRSLAEVRELLSQAQGHEGLNRLKARVGAEFPADFGMDTEEAPLTLTAVVTRCGFPRDELEVFAKNGIIELRDEGGELFLRDHDVAVVDALARLREAGFSADVGFRPEDAKIYLDALQELLRKEVNIFLKRAKSGEDPEELVARAERGIKYVTPLLLAFRHKVIREMIETLPLPGKT
jgi:DNA-binding transcriptional MerR regulator